MNQDDISENKMDFISPSINFYVDDAEKSSQFYNDIFGFEETFRTPKNGTPDHIEMKKGDFTIGFATYSALRGVHGIYLENGPAKGEIVLWTENVDEAFEALSAREVKILRKPHNFIGTLRSMWVQDPDGNNIQVVSRITKKE